MKKKILFLFTLMLAATQAFAPVANAIEDEGDNGIDSITSEDIEKGKYADRGYLVISPVRVRYGRIEPGKVYTQTFRAINAGGAPISFELTVDPFWVENDTYRPIYSEPSNRTKITDWISFPDGTKYTLAPNDIHGDDDEVEIRVRVKVPLDITGGGQYAAIMANIINSGEKENVDLRARIAVPVYSTISGDVSYHGKLIDRSISGFSFDPSINATATIENSGNADFEATYKLIIESFFGDEEINKQEEVKILLPETKRIHKQSWNEAPALGVFNVTQEITYLNENGEEVVDTFKSIVVICPLWLILIVFLIIILIIIVAIMNSKRRKHEKKNKKPSWEQS